MNKSTIKKLSIVAVVVLTVAVAALSLSACSTPVAASRVLQNYAPWLAYKGELFNADYTETATYYVRNQTAENVYSDGRYTVNVRNVIGADVAVGDKTIANFQGYYATSALVMNNGDTIETQAALTRGMELVASYTRSVVVRNGEQITEIKSSDNEAKALKTLYVKIDADGNELERCEGTLKHKAFADDPHTDGALIYLYARCFGEKVSSLSIKIPDYVSDTSSVISITMSSATEKVALVDENNLPRTRTVVDEETQEPVEEPLDFDCFKIGAKSTATFPGQSAPFECWLALDGIGDEGNIVKPLLKIKEGPVTYTLISASAALTQNE